MSICTVIRGKTRHLNSVKKQISVIKRLSKSWQMSHVTVVGVTEQHYCSYTLHATFHTCDIEPNPFLAMTQNKIHHT